MLETFRENHKKIENNDNKYICLFFAYVSKTIVFGSSFSAEMNSAYKNTLISAFL